MIVCTFCRFFHDLGQAVEGGTKHTDERDEEEAGHGDATDP